MHLVCSWEGGGRKGVIEVCAEMKKIHLYLRIPGLVRREGLVGLKPGPSLFLASIPIPAHPWVPDSLSHSAVMGRLRLLSWMPVLFQRKEPLVYFGPYLQVAKTWLKLSARKGLCPWRNNPWGSHKPCVAL